MCQHFFWLWLMILVKTFLSFTINKNKKISILFLFFSPAVKNEFRSFTKYLNVSATTPAHGGLNYGHAQQPTRKQQWRRARHGTRQLSLAVISRQARKWPQHQLRRTGQGTQPLPPIRRPGGGRLGRRRQYITRWFPRVGNGHLGRSNVPQRTEQLARSHPEVDQCPIGRRWGSNEIIRGQPREVAWNMWQKSSATWQYHDRHCLKWANPTRRINYISLSFVFIYQSKSWWVQWPCQWSLRIQVCTY